MTIDDNCRNNDGGSDRKKITPFQHKLQITFYIQFLGLFHVRSPNPVKPEPIIFLTTENTEVNNMMHNAIVIIFYELSL